MGIIYREAYYLAKHFQTRPPKQSRQYHLADQSQHLPTICLHMLSYVIGKIDPSAATGILMLIRTPHSWLLSFPTSEIANECVDLSSNILRASPTHSEPVRELLTRKFRPSWWLFSAALPPRSLCLTLLSRVLAKMINFHHAKVSPAHHRLILYRSLLSQLLGYLFCLIPLFKASSQSLISTATTTHLNPTFTSAPPSAFRQSNFFVLPFCI